MGESVRCLATHEGQVAEGTVQLETDELRFRGSFRLVIPLRDVRQATAQDGRLAVDFSGGTATFDLGTRAARWAERILHPPTLFDKLGVKAGQRARLLGVPHNDFRRDLTSHGVRIASAAGDGEPDLVFFGAETPADLHAVGAAGETLPPRGALWIIYPKGRTDIREQDVLTAGRAAGLTDVKVVRFSGAHTALKFVVPVARRTPERVPG